MHSQGGLQPIRPVASGRRNPNLLKGAAMQRCLPCYVLACVILSFTVVSSDEQAPQSARQPAKERDAPASREFKSLAKIQQEYDRLLPLWQEERKQYSLSSNTYDYWKGQHGKAIIALGPAIIPQLMREVRKGDFFFNVPLAQITHINITDGNWISEQEASLLWLAWWDQGANKPK